MKLLGKIAMGRVIVGFSLFDLRQEAGAVKLVKGRQPDFIKQAKERQADEQCNPESGQTATSGSHPGLSVSYGLMKSAWKLHCKSKFGHGLRSFKQEQFNAWKQYNKWSRELPQVKAKNAFKRDPKVKEWWESRGPYVKKKHEEEKITFADVEFVNEDHSEFQNWITKNHDIPFSEGWSPPPRRSDADAIATSKTEWLVAKYEALVDISRGDTDEITARLKRQRPSVNVRYAYDSARKKQTTEAFDFGDIRYMVAWREWKRTMLKKPATEEGSAGKGVQALEEEYQRFKRFLNEDVPQKEKELKESRRMYVAAVNKKGNPTKVEETWQWFVVALLEAQVYGVTVDPGQKFALSEEYPDEKYEMARWDLFEDVLEVRHAEEFFEFRDLSILNPVEGQKYCIAKEESFLMLSKILEPNVIGHWTRGFYHIQKNSDTKSVTLDFEKTDWTVKNNRSSSPEAGLLSPEETPLVIYVPKDVRLELKNINIVGKHLTFIGAGEVKFIGRLEIGRDESTPGEIMNPLRNGHESASESATTTVIFGKDIVPTFPWSMLHESVKIRGGASTEIISCARSQ
jgi:hypothetical protein